MMVLVVNEDRRKFLVVLLWNVAFKHQQHSMLGWKKLKVIFVLMKGALKDANFEKNWRKLQKVML